MAAAAAAAEEPPGDIAARVIMSLYCCKACGITQLTRGDGIRLVKW